MNQLRRYLNRMVRRSVVVHLKSGSSIRGVLFAVYADSVVLRHASAATPQAKDFVDVDGEQVVLKGDVDWIQDLGTEAEK